MQSVSTLLKLLHAAAALHRLRTQLWPALLTLLPVLVALFNEHPVSLAELALTGLAFIGIGGPWVVGLVVQDRGQRCARRLFRGCGGRPAVKMLRDRDTTVDPATKRAWRTHLTQHSGVSLPTRTEEKCHPAAADKIYRRAVAGFECRSLDRLSIPALCQAKADYELLLNGLALRWPGLAAAVAALLWTCISHSSMSLGRESAPELVGSLTLHLGSVIVISVSVLLILVWLGVFRPSRVRSAARTYDRLLLELAGLEMPAATTAREGGLVQCPLRNRDVSNHGGVAQ